MIDSDDLAFPFAKQLATAHFLRLAFATCSDLETSCHVKPLYILPNGIPTDRCSIRFTWGTYMCGLDVLHVNNMLSIIATTPQMSQRKVGAVICMMYDSTFVRYFHVIQNILALALVYSRQTARVPRKLLCPFPKVQVNSTQNDVQHLQHNEARQQAVLSFGTNIRLQFSISRLDNELQMHRAWPDRASSVIY